MEELNTQKMENSPATSRNSMLQCEKQQIGIAFDDKRQLDEDIELQALFVKMNSTIDETPFHETKCQKIKQDLSYKAEFSMGHFLIFHLYQIIFYIFGPLSFIIFIRKPALMYNMGFWSFRQDVILQYIQWAGNVFCTFMYFYYDLLQPLEIGLLWFSLILRSLIVGAKFATLNEERIELYENTKLSEKTIQFDTVLFDWLLQSKKIKLLEIARSARRHDFDLQFFFFHFIVSPTIETQKALNQELTDTQQDEIQDGKYSGIALLSYFIESFQRQDTRKKNITLSALISGVIVVVPKVLCYQTYLEEDYQIILNAICGIFQVIAFNCSFLYLLIALDDMKRKLFLLEQCYYLISTKRVKCCECKLTPTVDINCPRTIEAWSMLRSIVFDYGASYHIRNQIYFTVLILFCIVSFIFALQIILDYYVLNYYYLVSLGILFSIYFGFVVCYLLSSAAVNSFFDDYKTQIENLKFICLDVKRMRKYYFEQNNSDPQNFVHKSFVNHLKEQHKDDLNTIYQRIDCLVDSLDSALQHIEYDSRNFPLKLYGIKITFPLLQNLTVGLFTIVSFVIQQRFSSSK